MIIELKTPITIFEESDGMSFSIKDYDGNVVADDGSAYGEYSQKMTLDIARRIVACVNACAGFSSDELAGANLHKDSIEAQNEIDELRADLATAEQDSRQKQARIDRLESERTKHLEEIQRLTTLANTAEKWRGIAMARDGDGRTVQEVQEEARTEEREACAALLESKAMAYSEESTIRLVMETNAAYIRARGQA